jgi:molybdopterin converting factor small subunit
MMTLNSNLPKKRGRPLGSKNKRKVAKKVGSKDTAFKQADVKKLIQNLNDSVATEQETIILNLEHQIVGYKAVISYLEHKLGKK